MRHGGPSWASQFEGQTVREALELVYTQLADDVVPTAERLLGS